jgi:hypothetical protein
VEEGVGEAGVKAKGKNEKRLYPVQETKKNV